MSRVCERQTSVFRLFVGRGFRGNAVQLDETDIVIRANHGDYSRLFAHSPDESQSSNTRIRHLRRVADQERSILRYIPKTRCLTVDSFATHERQYVDSLCLLWQHLEGQVRDASCVSQRPRRNVERRKTHVRDANVGLAVLLFNGERSTPL